MKNTIIRILGLGILTAACAVAQDAASQPPEQPAPIEPPVLQPAVTQPVDAAAAPIPGLTPGQPDTGMPVVPGSRAPDATGVTNLAATGASGSSVKDFQGDDVGQVLRLLARQAKVNLVVSEKVVGTLTMRLENKAPLDSIRVICTAKNLDMTEQDGVYFVRTMEERAAEATEPGNFTFSYAQAEKIAPLLQTQLRSGAAPQIDTRTNTVFYREVKSNMDAVKLFLRTVDKPTQQVMIEARLVEVTANPQQSYGINWAGTFGSASQGKTVKFGASPIPEDGKYEYIVGNDGSVQVLDTVVGGNGTPSSLNSIPDHLAANLAKYAAGQYSILTAPQLSATLRLLNEDKDAEFLANPRIVTANNQKPQLNFNEQTATAVFGGFEDKEFGNTLEVLPSINKDNFITMNVKPEISNKVGDATFTFAGATVASPVIDKRQLESNVLIKSGNTLAIGGLLQDEVGKGRTKVPILGDIPIIGYAFQERMNSRVKRNLLVFVTPTIIKPGQGTGLESQVSGLENSGEEFADPNGWRNNARGSIRLVKTPTTQIFSEYPAPGTPLDVKYKTSASGRER
jgi:type IV pilus assembly protein PilQ